jgi:hypothetical protein
MRELYYGASISSVKITMDEEQRGLVDDDFRKCVKACPQGDIFRA